MNFDWKSVNKENIEDLKDRPNLYIRLLAVHEEWNKLIQSLDDRKLYPYALSALKKSQTQEKIFKDRNEYEIIDILDKTNDVVRRQIFIILLKNFDKMEVASKVGDKIMKDIAKHQWAIKFRRELLSIQPSETLKVALNARYKPKHNKLPLNEFWQKITEKEHEMPEDKVKANKRSEFLSPNDFVHFEYFSKRKSFSEILANNFIEVLQGYETKKHYFTRFLIRAKDQFLQFSSFWLKDKQIREKVSKAIISFPFEKVKKFNFIQLIQNNFHYEYLFNLNWFIDHKVIKPNDILFEIFPRCFKVAMQAEPNTKQYRYLSSLCFMIFDNLDTWNVNFFNYLRYVSQNEPQNVLNDVWNELLNKVKMILLEELKKQEMGMFNLITRYLKRKEYNNIENFGELPSNYLPLSFDYIMDLIISGINDVISRKKEIVKSSPEQYTNMLSNILRQMIDKDWMTEEDFTGSIKKEIFYLLPQDVQDKIIHEIISDPTGNKLFNNQFTKSSSTVPIGFSLLLNDLGKIAKSLANSSKINFDQYGFSERTIIYQPYITQEKLETIEAKEQLHLFERLILQCFKHKNTKIANMSFTLYHLFIQKLCSIAIDLDSDELYQRAAEAHIRFCHLCICKGSRSVVSNNIKRFILYVCHPIRLYCGTRYNKEYGKVIFEQLFEKIPFSHSKMIIPLEILRVILSYSYSKQLTNLDSTYEFLVRKLIEMIDLGLPNSFTTQNINIPNDYKYVYELNNKKKMIENFKKIVNIRSNLQIPKGFAKIFSIDLRSKKLTQKCSGVFCDPAIFTKDLIESFEDCTLTSSSAPILEVLKILKTKVDNYNPVFYESLSLTHPSLLFINVLISMVTQVLNVPTINKNIPEIPDFPYEKTNSVESYLRNVKKLNILDLPILKSTIFFVRTLFPSDSLYERLFKENPIEIFQIIDKTLTFVPYTVEEEKKWNGNPPEKHYQNKLSITFKPDKSTLMRIRAVEEKPKPKPKRTNGKSVKVDNTPKKNPQFEKWMSDASLSTFSAFFEADGKVACEYIKEDGPNLGRIVLILRNQSKLWQDIPKNTNIFGNMYNLLFNDLLYEQNSKTRFATPTLFYTKNREIKESVVDKNYGESNNSGYPYFIQTKLLIGVLSEIIQREIFQKKFTSTLFESSLMNFLSYTNEVIKAKIGDDNANHFVDHFCTAMINSEIQKQLFYKIFTCDIFSSIALEQINKMILSLTKEEKKKEIVKSFIDALTNYKYSYTLATKIKVISWALDYHYVGMPIPQFCIDYIDKISKEPKLHIDLRRTIAASIVAYFKNQYLLSIYPMQTDIFFRILRQIYNTKKTEMAPIFIQLTRPKFCRMISLKSQVYLDLMPKKSYPINFINPQNFKELSMPRYGDWKQFYQEYLSSFVGTSLLSNDEHIVQLTIQVLTKIGVNEGELANRTSSFLTKAFEDFNVVSPLAILLNFAFKFCLNSVHQGYKEMCEKFIGIFSQTRKAIDDIGMAHIKSIWLHKNYNEIINSYKPLGKTCQIFIDCFNDVLSNIKNESDCKYSSYIAKRILIALDENRALPFYFDQFESLKNIVKILSDDDLMYGIFTKPSEDALKHLILFLNNNLSIISKQSPQGLINNLFYKNVNSMTYKLIDEISEFSYDFAQNKTVIDLLTPIFTKFFETHQDDENIVNAMVKLWKFAPKELIPYESAPPGDMAPRMMCMNSIQPPMALGACCFAKAAPMAKFESVKHSLMRKTAMVDSISAPMGVMNECIEECDEGCQLDAVLEQPSEVTSEYASDVIESECDDEEMNDEDFFNELSD